MEPRAERCRDPAGAIEVVAGDRQDTVVTVSPTNPAKEADRRGAEATTVTFDGTRVTVVAPKPRLSLIGPNESVDVRVELPSGSRLTAEIAAGWVRTSGRLGATRLKAASGGASLGTTGDLWLRAGHGSVSVVAADGDVEVTAEFETGEAYGIGVKTDNTELLEAVNASLARIQEDGTYDEIYEEWFGTTPTS